MGNEFKFEEYILKELVADGLISESIMFQVLGYLKEQVNIEDETIKECA